MTPTLSVKDLCERWAVGHHTIYEWLASGELKGINVSRKNQKRPLWRFKLEDVEAFEEKRSNRPSTATKPRKRTRKATSAVKYYPE